MEHIPHDGLIFRSPEDQYRFQELDFGEMKWVSREKTMGECASFLSDLKHGVVDKPESHEWRWEGLLQGHSAGDMLTLIEVEEAGSKTATMWYFPHECFKTFSRCYEPPLLDMHEQIVHSPFCFIVVGTTIIYILFFIVRRARTRSMTRNQNHNDNDDDDDASSAGPWTELNHHMLYLVMMQLGVVDYLSFSGVCKSWRSFALSNRNMFMASRPPMTMSICWGGGKIKSFYLEDFEGRKFKTNPFFVGGGACVGLTCGYLIFFGKTTRDFLLVNPITRHELSFTAVPLNFFFYIIACSTTESRFGTRNVRAILVFSPSIGGWVCVVTRKGSNLIWFSTAGTGAWNHVSCDSHFTGLCVCKRKIYTLNLNFHTNLCEVYQLRLYPDPKLTLLETKKSFIPSEFSELVSSGENIYVMDCVPPNGNNYTRGRTRKDRKDRYRFQELDFGEMKWVSREKTVGECASFLSDFKHGVAVNPELCGTHSQGLLLGHNMGDMLKLIEVQNASSYSANMWYFPHECLKVDRLDEW